jgi:hypothetical protein
MSVTAEWLCGTQGRRDRKREWQSISSVVKHHICEGGGGNDVYWKLLKNGGREREGEQREGVTLERATVTWLSPCSSLIGQTSPRCACVGKHSRWRAWCCLQPRPSLGLRNTFPWLGDTAISVWWELWKDLSVAGQNRVEDLPFLREWKTKYSRSPFQANNYQRGI